MSGPGGLARELLLDFARRTGVEGGAPPRRYLWTDALAVRALLDLRRRTGEARLGTLALELVGQVHRVLGRHRGDDPRQGWISGLGEEEGERHPTAGGLRIGKELPERRPDEPPDPRREWDRDGQYFHYLTQWARALAEAAAATGDPGFLRWARELAVAAQRGFTRSSPGGPPRLAWKMSIDLSRPLVAGSGHHDPLDALVLALELEAAAPPPGGDAGPSLAAEVAAAGAMVAGGAWATDDPLGIGGLLDLAARLAGLVARGAADRRDLLAGLLADARASLDAFARSPLLDLPVARRLAFREIGLGIGLRAVGRLAAPAGPALDSDTGAAVAGLRRHLPLAAAIEHFWSDPARRRGAAWLAHRDIDEVMLAASLVAAGDDG